MPSKALTLVQATLPEQEKLNRYSTIKLIGKEYRQVFTTFLFLSCNSFLYWMFIKFATYNSSFIDSLFLSPHQMNTFSISISLLSHYSPQISCIPPMLHLKRKQRKHLVLPLFWYKWLSGTLLLYWSKISQTLTAFIYQYFEHIII